MHFLLWLKMLAVDKKKKNMEQLTRFTEMHEHYMAQCQNKRQHVEFDLLIQ